MLRRLRLPMVPVLIVGIAAVALLAFLPAEEAKAPDPDTSQELARQEAQDLVEAQAEEPVTTQAVTAGFQDRLFADAPGATALAFLPDGGLLVTDRRGIVRLRKPDTTTNTSQALDISNVVCSNSERGLLGLAVDPNFENNGYVYLYYTYKKFGTCPEGQPERNNPVNRVSRFKMAGDTIDRDPEQVLINNIPSPNGNHNAGDLHFGNDGKLYVSTGDGSCNYAAPGNCQPENEASRYRNVLLGKILRINPDGTIPDDNPYAASPDGVRCGQINATNASGGAAAAPDRICQETYAMGFRNPFRFAIDPDVDTGVGLRVNDVGGARIEEVSQVKKGGDYGWNCREGTLVLNITSPCPGNSMQPPIHQYQHNTGCSSITGGAFVPNNAGWPSSYREAYLYGDYVCGRIYSLKPNSNGGYSRTVFASGLEGGPVSFAFGPDGALYYTTYAAGGQVRRVAFTANKAPVAKATANPTPPGQSTEAGDVYGPLSLNVRFDASGSTDDENDPLTYEWDFDLQKGADGTDQFTVDATGANATHTYDTAGAYRAALRLKDDQGNTSDVEEVAIYAGNTAAPEPAIESITGLGVTNNAFEANRDATLRGSATDADGQAVELKWEVIRHHTAPNEHTHPSILDTSADTGTSITFRTPGPEDLYSTNPNGNYLEVRLTATDSQGLSKTVTQNLRPETTGIAFNTRPSRFYLTVNGQRVRAPRTILAWENSNLNVYAPPQMYRGNRYVFRDWSDGKGNRHTIEVPQDGKTYVARFRQR